MPTEQIVDTLGERSPNVARIAKDHELERHVIDVLRRLNRSAARNVTIEFADGVLTLRGLVGTFYTKQMFLHHVRQTPGVVAVVDDLRVE